MAELISDSASDEDMARSARATGSGTLKRDRSSDPHTEDVQRRKRRDRGSDTPEDKTAIIPDQYTVGWVCALPLEMAAARGMLDEIHPNLPEQNPADHNSYILGRIQGHNVVIACLPAGIYGTTPASTVAKDMLRTFKSIRFGLLVGIGGGAPSSKHDIRLGDIVVSQPSGTNGGVIQYDRGKTVQDGKFQRTGSLNAPPQVLLAALSRLQADHMSTDSRIPRFLSEIIRKSPQKMKKKFDYQGSPNDYLFQTEYDHIDLAPSCDQCDRTQSVLREPRDDTNPVIHYGLIASGNQVIKDGRTRDRLSKDLGGVLCFEMEAAGLQDFPCLVIRGICDYADSHKNKMWQEYAAAAAAAFAKELLSVIAPGRVLKEKPVPQLVSDPCLQALISSTKMAVSEHMRKQDIRYENQEHVKCHQTFKTSMYEAFKNMNPKPVPGTCKWALKHPRYTNWQESPHDDLLWISADPGCGKSVLAKSLIDEELRSREEHTVYFFFKDNDEQNNLATALCALLHQLFHAQPLLLRHAMDAFEKNGKKLQKESDELWRIFLDAATDDQARSVTCVLDALDECRVDDRRKLLQFLTSFLKRQASSTRKSRLKFLVTSRPYQDIETEFRDIPEPQSIRLAGEDSNTDISEEINLVIKDEVATISHNLHLDQQTQEALQEKLLSVSHRTYLWLHLVLDEIRRSKKRTEKAFMKRIGSLPTTVEDAYEKILDRLNSCDGKEARILLHIVVGARRPLTLSEMDVAFQMATDSPDAEAHEDLDLDQGHLKSRIRELCGLFVFVDDDRIYLIHQTAKDFLIAKDCLTYAVDGCWKYSLASQQSDALLTQICVQYLSFRDIKDSYSPASRRLEDVETGTYPLLDYSAAHWPAHARNAGSNDEKSRERMFGLYNAYDQLFQIWFPKFWKSKYHWKKRRGITNVHVAALNGHDKVLARLLELDQKAINTPDKEGRTPLIWGCEEGHDAVVQMLLDRGADVNVQVDSYRTALQTALFGGYEKIVQILLNNGADTNALSGLYSEGTALRHASFEGHEKIIQMLLDKGADVNTQSGRYGTALQAASQMGHEKIVQILLDKGADTNAPSGLYSEGTALYHASFEGHEKIVQMLLDKGADVNAQSGRYGTALQAAFCEGHGKVAQMLLDKGADIDAPGGL